MAEISLRIYIEEKKILLFSYLKRVLRILMGIMQPIFSILVKEAKSQKVI